MKTKTIWESASRPLFLRSVWLDTTGEGRGIPQRHFILDYLPQQKQQKVSSKSVESPHRSWQQRESFQYSTSCDYPDFLESNESQLSAEDLLLIGSAKIRLQQQATKNHKPHEYRNRHQRKFLKFQRQTIDGYGGNPLNRRLRGLQELYSIHSSLQDMQSQISNAASSSNIEERLAERVLNWLDLAGKNELLRPANEVNSPIDIIEREYAAIEEARNRKSQSKAHNKQRKQTQPKFYQRYQQQMLTQSANISNAQSKRKIFVHSNRKDKAQSSDANNKTPQRDSVKPITIIFNREGFPVRFNRPARNIDLCALTSSVGATRRVAGPLASSRLYKGNEMLGYKMNSGRGPNVAQKKVPHQQQQQQQQKIPLNREEKLEKSATTASQKQSALNRMQDSKRQLHIFMPSLPKKGMASGSNCGGTDEANISVLSNNFEENCLI